MQDFVVLDRTEFLKKKSKIIKDEKQEKLIQSEYMEL